MPIVGEVINNVECEYKGKFWALGERLYGTSVLTAQFSINLTALKNKVLNTDTCALSMMQTFFSTLWLSPLVKTPGGALFLHWYNTIQKIFPQHIDMSSPKINIFILTGLDHTCPNSSQT